MLTNVEAMLEMQTVMESALQEINTISRKVDREFDKFADAIGFNGAYNGLKEALWLIEFEMKYAKSEGH